MKKLSKALFFAVITICFYCVLTFVSSAKDFNGMIYETCEGEVTITGCDKSISGNLYVPSTIEGEKVVCIGEDAFKDCTGITGIYIPESIEKIGNGGNPFAGCKNVETITVDEENRFYDSRNDCNAIVSKGKNELISGCNNSVIDESVVVIGKGAFYGCDGLVDVFIPDNVLHILDDAYAECNNLKTFSFPDCISLDGIYTYPGGGMTQRVFSYENRNNLTVTIRRSQINKPVTVWIASVFHFSKRVIIEDKETEIHDTFASHGGNDTLFIVPHNSKAYYYMKTNGGVIHHERDYTYEFSDPHTVVSVKELSPSCTADGHSAYDYCEECGRLLAEKIEYPSEGHSDKDYNGVCDKCGEKINLLGNGFYYTYDHNTRTLTFKGNGPLKLDYTHWEILDNNIQMTERNGEVIGISCFDNLNVVFGEGITSLSTSGFSLEYAVSVTFPSTLIEIKNYTFYDWNDIRTVNFTNGLKRIGDWAFDNCFVLENIVIPETVEYIGEYAFANCFARNITILSKNVTLSKNCFGYGCYKSTDDNLFIGDIFKELFEIDRIIRFNTIEGEEEGYPLVSDDFSAEDWYRLMERERFLAEKVFYPFDDVVQTDYDDIYFHPYSNDATIKGYKNSSAEKYADKNNIKFVAIEKDSIEVDDSNPKNFFDKLMRRIKAMISEFKRAFREFGGIFKFKK